MRAVPLPCQILIVQPDPMAALNCSRMFSLYIKYISFHDNNLKLTSCDTPTLIGKTG
jgi:hypothetical protein